MRAKNNPCPETGAQCYVPDCSDSRCDFQEPDNGKAGILEPSFITPEPFRPSEAAPTPANPALETRVENTEKAVTDLYWQLKQLKEKWEGKKE